ncbi:MAG: bile acid:sodium symporter family protein [Bacteroidia bacterium]
MHDELVNLRINFNEDALGALNFALAFIMFGIALNLKKSDFKALFKSPKAAIIGLISQYLMLPALTVLLIAIVKPSPYLALGMLLVAACPGGNVSNFFSHRAKGNVALSVALSMVSTLGAFLFTPLLFGFWGSILPETHELLKAVDISFLKLVKIILTILIVPLLLGMAFSKKYPILTEKLKSPISIISFLILIGIIVGGLLANTEIFKQHYQRVVYLVFAHNGAALLFAFILGILTGLGRASTKTITIETGIQNSGLGLVLVFNFFDGNGAMAIITAWWGIWHIISGFALSQIFRKYYC